jgi:hypothetical protein
MFRYRLSSLFLGLLYLSIGFAALVNASGVWPQVAVTMTVAILTLVSLAALFWVERKRAFAIGFSATGWLYFLLVSSSVTNVRPYLVTDTATIILFATIHTEPAAPIGFVWETGATAAGPVRVRRVMYPAAPVVAPPPIPSTTVAAGPTLGFSTTPAGPQIDFDAFSNIAHSLWAVVVGLIGGITAQLLYARSNRWRDAFDGEKQP